MGTVRPTWWVQCAVVALACLQVIAPTWHICSMGATGPAPSHQAAMAQCACSAPTQDGNAQNVSQIDNVFEEHFCLAKLLQSMLGNSQYRLILDFNPATVGVLKDDFVSIALTRSLPVEQARGPPLFLS